MCDNLSITEKVNKNSTLTTWKTIGFMEEYGINLGKLACEMRESKLNMRDGLDVRHFLFEYLYKREIPLDYLTKMTEIITFGIYGYGYDQYDEDGYLK